MGLAPALDDPFFTGGSSTSSEVPGLYPVAIGGHVYKLDDAQGWGFETIAVLRNAWITSDQLGEKNINPESLWRVSQDTWHKGAGQTHLDRSDSDSARFRSSKGIDIWTRWQMSLLPDTVRDLASANTNLMLAVAGAYLYASDGNSLKFTQTNLSATTTLAGTPAAAITALCTDGNTVYAGYSATGVYSTTRGATGSPTHYITDAVTFDALGYELGRLVGGVGSKLYNLTATGALSTAATGSNPLIYTHPNSDFKWVGFASGPNAIYALGYSGTVSEVYRITIKSDGSGLDVPVPACPALPSGETATGIGDYRGLVFIGTDKGWRMAEPDSSGYLSVGALIETAAARCFAGWGRFIYGGWDDYDGTSTGLVRIDPSTENDTLVPAYASDLMATAQGHVTAVATFGSKRVFAVSGDGFYREDTNLVASGTLDTGVISYDIPEDKIAYYLDVRHDSLAGTHAESVSVEGGTFTGVGTHTEGGIEGRFTLPDLRGEFFEVRHTLSRSSTDTTTGPTILRATLYADPAVSTGRIWTLPLKMSVKESVQNRSRTRDVDAEVDYLYDLRENGTKTTLQIGSRTESVKVTDMKWVVDNEQESPRQYEGTLIVQLKTV